jgi:hypothetical protein
VRPGFLTAAMVVASVLQAAPQAERPAAAAPSQTQKSQRHHYTMSARVRPLLFWIGRDDVGDAVIARRRDADAIGYSLLIGSDPERAPRRINRWGYIDEEIRGGEATLVGLMTESDEESVSQAEANVHKQEGQRTFNVIHASIAGGEARSVVTAIAAPSDYTFRRVDTLLDLAARTQPNGKTRVIRFPAGTRSGFLAAVADLVHAQVNGSRRSQQTGGTEPIGYVYHGKLYQLRVTRTRSRSNVQIGSATYERALASDFQIKNLHDGELTDFSITYGVDGALAETPLAITYQPRWWLEVRLTLDDRTPGPSLARVMP